MAGTTLAESSDRAFRRATHTSRPTKIKQNWLENTMLRNAARAACLDGRLCSETMYPAKADKTTMPQVTTAGLQRRKPWPAAWGVCYADVEDRDDEDKYCAQVYAEVKVAQTRGNDSFPQALRNSGTARTI